MTIYFLDFDDSNILKEKGNFRTSTEKKVN